MLSTAPGLFFHRHFKIENGFPESLFEYLSSGQVSNEDIVIFLTGRGYAMTVAARTLLPILHESGIDYEILLTEYPGHAQQVMRNEASARWRGIVTGK